MPTNRQNEHLAALSAASGRQPRLIEPEEAPVEIDHSPSVAQVECLAGPNGVVLRPGAALVLADALTWLEAIPEASVHAVVTDPPYGVVEYEDRDHNKLRSGRGGVWRIPPTLDDAASAVPRFTVLSPIPLGSVRLLPRQLPPFARPGARGARVRCFEPTAIQRDVYGLRAGRVGEARRSHKAGADPQRRRQAKGCGSRIPGGHRHASLLLGAVGAVPQALRRHRCGQPPRLGNRRPAPQIRDRAVPRCDPLLAHAPGRARHRTPPITQAPEVPPRDRPRGAPSGTGDPP